LDAKVIPWDLVWEKAAHWFPSVRRFVVEKCCGIGVAVEGPLAPSLTYVFPLISGGGRIFQGSVPSGEPGLEAGNSVNLPIDFNVFFQSVHNGFVNDVGVGIWPFKKSMMSDLISVSDAFGDEEGIPFDLSHLVVLYSNGSGDYICVDVSQSASNKIVGGTYWHDDPFESVFNRDVKKLVNEKFDSRSTAFATRAQ
jgi:hypothetical protein